MALWHLLQRLAPGLEESKTAQIVNASALRVRFPRGQATRPGLPGVPTVGCALVIALGCLAAAFDIVRAVARLQLDVALVYGVALANAGLFLVAVVSRSLGVPLLRDSLFSATQELQHACAAVVTQVIGRSPTTFLQLDADTLQQNPEWALQCAFTPLASALEESYLFKHVDFSTAHTDLCGSSTASALAQVATADQYIDELEQSLLVAERQHPDPDSLTVKSQREFMSAELRRVGGQILRGFRAASAPIALAQCPGCGGPVTSESTDCPYCGSSFVRK